MKTEIGQKKGTRKRKNKDGKKEREGGNVQGSQNTNRGSKNGCRRFDGRKNGINRPTFGSETLGKGMGL